MGKARESRIGLCSLLARALDTNVGARLRRVSPGPGLARRLALWAGLFTSQSHSQERQRAFALATASFPRSSLARVA